MRIASFFLLFLGDEEKHHRLTTSHFYPSNMLSVFSQKKSTCRHFQPFQRSKKSKKRLGLGSPHSKLIVTYYVAQLDLKHPKDYQSKSLVFTLPEIRFLCQADIFGTDWNTNPGCSNCTTFVCWLFRGCGGLGADMIFVTCITCNFTC